MGGIFVVSASDSTRGGFGWLLLISNVARSAKIWNCSDMQSQSLVKWKGWDIGSRHRYRNDPGACATDQRQAADCHPCEECEDFALSLPSERHEIQVETPSFE
jgi:hypothetical protein